MDFKLVSEYKPTGDQPEAIAQLVDARANLVGRRVGPGLDVCRQRARENAGLPGVCRILERLHAEYVYDYKDGWFQFTAEIPGK